MNAQSFDFLLLPILNWIILTFNYVQKQKLQLTESDFLTMVFVTWGTNRGQWSPTKEKKIGSTHRNSNPVCVRVCGTAGCGWDWMSLWAHTAQLGMGRWQKRELLLYKTKINKFFLSTGIPLLSSFPPGCCLWSHRQNVRNISTTPTLRSHLVILTKF